MNIVEVFQGHNIEIRPNGYWNGSALCRTESMQIESFLSEGSVHRYLEALSEDLSFPVIEVVSCNKISEPTALIQCIDYGESQRWEIWVHEEVAMKLTGWLNPKLEIWFHRTIKKLIKEGEVKLKDEIHSLAKALSLKEEQLEKIGIEYAQLEYRHDRQNYIVDELKRDMHWHRMNSWG